MISRLVAKYPVIKTMSAYFCINVAADFNEQVFIKGRTKETYDRGKTARIAATCTFVTSPMMFVWIRFIDKAIPGKALISVMKKVLSDAFIFAPCIISTFYITTNLLENKKNLTEEWKQKFYQTWTTGLCYWPFVQTVNFAMIPMKYKTCVYMPTASFIWMNYLCFMKDKKIIHGDDETEAISVQQSRAMSNSGMSVLPVSTINNIAMPQIYVLNNDSKINLPTFLCADSKESEMTSSVTLNAENRDRQQPKPHISQPSENIVSMKSGVMCNSDSFIVGVILCPH